ncbi:hypothetical protein DL96DRAFT_269771 [Flagelloscypha sp. PMI_526]|nr:hypothetical protein DL96DRAFT_269771 [Flagelloscypha sp. PMI_526]
MRKIQSAEDYEAEHDVLFKQVTLTNLPHDLLLRIFSLSSAHTVVKLRQCCKEFYKLSKEYIVWLQVLKRTCAELDLPVPSFPHTTRTSVNTELLATAWVRFQSVLKSAKHGQPLPYKRAHPIDITEPILTFEQSVDGRFLFVVHNTRINVWSLAANSPHLAHSYAVEIPEQCWASLSFETEGSDSIVLYLFLNAPLPRTYQWIAFRFSFPSHGHEGAHLDYLSRLDCLAFPAEYWGNWTSLSSLMSTYFEHPSEGRCCLLWDAAKGACVTWVADKKDTASDAIFLFIHDFIVSFDRASQVMVMYAFPEVPEKSSYAPKICGKLNNPALLYVPAQTGTLHRRLVAKLSWTSSFTNGFAASDYDSRAMIYDVGDGSWLLEHVALSRTDLPSETFSSLPLKLERVSSPQILDSISFPIHEGAFALAYMSPDKTLFLHAASKDWTRVVFHLGALAGNDRGFELGRGILCDFDEALEDNRRSWSLSPFTGRLCVATLGGIDVIDFVDLPYL